MMITYEACQHDWVQFLLSSKLKGWVSSMSLSINKGAENMKNDQSHARKRGNAHFP